MPKRSIIVLAGFFVAVLAAVVIAIAASHCPTVVSEGICLTPKNPSAEPQMPEGKAPDPAPSHSTETAAPSRPITVDQSLKKFDGFTGKSQEFLYIDTATTSTSMIGIEITQEGYKKLLDSIGFKEASLPSTVYLTRFSAESIGITSDNPSEKFVLIVK